MNVKPKVLIVDNDDRVLMALQAALENANFDTRATWSGREALEWLSTETFDVLLVDDYLPDLHTGEFLKLVGRRPVQPKVILMRGGTMEKPRQSQEGISAVVNKRHEAEVCKTIASCLQRTLPS